MERASFFARLGKSVDSWWYRFQRSIERPRASEYLRPVASCGTTDCLIRNANIDPSASSTIAYGRAQDLSMVRMASMATMAGGIFSIEMGAMNLTFNLLEYSMTGNQVTLEKAGVSILSQDAMSAVRMPGPVGAAGSVILSEMYGEARTEYVTRGE